MDVDGVQFSMCKRKSIHTSSDNMLHSIFVYTIQKSVDSGVRPRVKNVK